MKHHLLIDLAETHRVGEPISAEHGNADLAFET
jgi:hypothetical protein